MNENKKLMSGIKSKLIAAICMLLVAVIMVVSSTYAWFTLSTAPEVTGIKTAVGANGALEMLLLTADANGQFVYNEGVLLSQSQDVVNTYWGNLVDVSDNGFYGLDQITLYPSLLNLDKETNTFGATVLKTPSYGSDGRVSTLDANALIGIYREGKFYPTSDTDGNRGYGVRAVGVASGMTARQLSYKNALSAADTATSLAKKYAAQSLNENGSTLANIAIKKAGSSTTYSQTDVAALQKIVDDLLTKVIPKIEEAYMQYILVYASSKGQTEEAYIGVNGLVSATGATLDSVINGLNGEGVTLPSELNTYIEALKTTKANVNSAKSDLVTMASYSTIEWSDSSDGATIGLSTPMYKLADVDNMKINGISASAVKDHMSDLVNAVASGGLKVTIASGGGVYADVADHCGDYNASVTIEEVEYNGITLNKVNARMETVSNIAPSYLSRVNTATTATGSPDGGATGTMPITEFYGYIIDLAFKTNASESNLLLQADGIDRIYQDNDSTADTFGAGSTMTFAGTTNDFSDENVEDLMKCIRIVFFQPGTTTNTIYAYAKLDVANAELGADGITAKMYLYEEVEYYTVTNVDSTTQTVYKSGDKYYTDIACNTEYTKPETSTISDKATGIEERKLTDNIITSMPQNQIKHVSVLVYLDGNTIGNEDVAATSLTSMTGKMNLQFASSATLVPMTDAGLKQDAQD